MYRDLTQININDKAPLTQDLTEFLSQTTFAKQRPWLAAVSDILKIEQSQPETEPTSQINHVSFVLDSSLTPDTNSPLMEAIRKVMYTIRSVKIISPSEIEIRTSRPFTDFNIASNITVLAFIYPMFTNTTPENLELARDIVRISMENTNLSAPNKLQELLYEYVTRTKWREMDMFEGVRKTLDYAKQNARKTIEEDIAATERCIAETVERLQDLYDQKRRNIEDLAMNRYHTEKIELAFDQLLNFLKKCSILTYVKFDQTYIHMKFQNTLTVSDLEFFRHNYDTPVSPALHKIIAWCLDPNTPYKIMCEGRIKLNVTAFPVSSASFSRDEGTYHSSYYNFLPAPHIAFHNCWGTSTPHMLKAMTDRNYVVAINIAIQVLFQLTWSDSTVCNDIFLWIENNPDKKTFINTETGEYLSYNEVKGIYDEKLKNNE